MSQPNRHGSSPEIGAEALWVDYGCRGASPMGANIGALGRERHQRMLGNWRTTAVERDGAVASVCDRCALFRT
jgi:hypothetical protein